MAPWDHTEDRQLLLSVISVAQVNPNWEEVANQMGKTKEAVRYDRCKYCYDLWLTCHYSQRFAKLKKGASETATTATSDDGTAAPAAVATPTPRKRKTKAKKAASDDDDDDEGTPLTKKTKKLKTVVKEEDEDEAEA
ncbi:unnamed protein product [Aureobasidium uvarum]|uniref:Myb-like domain-containing protein n=1 Tax=Aureobasidium uvarum TaxID=2773716 RepID=A0A9N8PRE2_9PEZI|nr:unnamed protein product [Aureobasidium uvarum]